MEKIEAAFDRSEPTGTRVVMPKHYEIAKSGAALLPWSEVSTRLEQATNYWLATTMPDGRPHVTPVWGAWVDQTFYFDGIYTARWAQNLAANAAMSIHLESGTDVVIVDGVGDDSTPNAEVCARIVASWTAKYGRLIPDPSTGMYRLRPRSIRAWSRFPHDATRWRFE